MNQNSRVLGWFRFCFSLLAAGVASYAVASPRLQFQDQVIKLSLSKDKTAYMVLFKNHAAFYHFKKIADNKNLANCLISSIRQNQAANVVVDPFTLEIQRCGRTS